MESHRIELHLYFVFQIETVTLNFVLAIVTNQKCAYGPENANISDTGELVKMCGEVNSFE